MKSYYPWVIWGVAASFFLAEYFARVSPGIMIPELMAAFKVNALDLGTLSAFFYIAYLGMQVPVGALVDFFGPHRLLTIMAVICAAGCLLFAYSTNLVTAEIARFLIGFGAAFAFVGTLKLASMWFSSARFGLLAGLTQGLGMLGAAIGGGPLQILSTSIGWRDTIIAVAIVLFIIALLIWLLVRDKKTAELDTKEKPAFIKHAFGGLGTILSNKQTWVNATYVGLLYAPTAAFAELWGVQYVKQVHHASPDVAASAISTIFIGWVACAPLAGWFSDKIRRRKPIMIASSIAGLIFMGIALYITSIPTWLLFVLLFLYGMSNVGVAMAYAVSAEINPPRTAGVSLGFTNMFSVIIGALFQPIIGWILDYTSVSTLKSPHVYTAHSFKIAMLALPICLLLSFGLAFFVKETNCKQVVS